MYSIIAYAKFSANLTISWASRTGISVMAVVSSFAFTTKVADKVGFTYAQINRVRVLEFRAMLLSVLEHDLAFTMP